MQGHVVNCIIEVQRTDFTQQTTRTLALLTNV